MPVEKMDVTSTAIMTSSPNVQHVKGYREREEAGGEVWASTLSLKSVDSNSNPRQAALKRSLGTIPCRHLQPLLRQKAGEMATRSLDSPPPPGVSMPHVNLEE